MKLPTAAKAIGILCFFGGLWNGAIGTVMLLAKPTISLFVDMPMMRAFLVASTVMGWYFTVCSCAFLLRKKLGKRSLILGFWIVMGVALDYVACMVVIQPDPIVIAAALPALALPSAILLLLIRYLKSEQVLTAFETGTSKGVKAIPPPLPANR